MARIDKWRRQGNYAICAFSQQWRYGVREPTPHTLRHIHTQGLTFFPLPTCEQEHSGPFSCMCPTITVLLSRSTLHYGLGRAKGLWITLEDGATTPKGRGVFWRASTQVTHERTHEDCIHNLEIFMTGVFHQSRWKNPYNELK